LIPDFPLTHPLLNAFQAETTASIRELNGLARPVFNVVTRIDLGREGVRVTSASAENERGGGGKLTGTLIPNAEGIPELSMLLEGSDLVLGIPKAPGEDVATLPPYSLRLKLDGAGQTTRELAASLDGYFNMTMGEGIVLNAGLDRVTNSFIQELSKALDPLREEEESTKINCEAAFSVLSQGRLHGKPAVVIDTPNVKVLADASANLESEKIKVQFKTVPQKGLGLSMSSIVNPYVEVTGTLAQPRLSLNPEHTVVGGSLAVITGGISILVRNVLDRLSTSGNVCADRLRDANEEMAAMDA
jgi:AsmA protein